MKGLLSRLIILSFSLLFISPITSRKVKANNSSPNTFSDNNQLSNENIQLQSEYILGTGDFLYIIFTGIREFSRVYNIDFEGNINLPELKKFKTSGLTIKELENKLNIEYKKFIKVPDIDVVIFKNRPVNVFIKGEVKKPGLYTLSYNQNISSSDIIGDIPDTTSAPKIFDALKLSQGFTNYADLKNVSLTRTNSISQGGGKIKTNINLLSFLLEGDQSQNIRILDGDIIEISKSEKIVKDQILSINRTNINPDFIVVYITGNVVNSGSSELKNGSSLNQAIASNGGKKLLTGNIEFLRFDNNGSLKKNIFRYDQNALPNTKRNPILMDGDIINVNKTKLGVASEIIGEISTPLFSGYGLYKFISGS